MLQLNSLLLINFVLSPINFQIDSELRKKVISYLEKSNIINTMVELSFENDKEIEQHLKRFIENNPELGEDIKLGISEKKNSKTLGNKNCLTMLNSLYLKLSKQDCYPQFVSLVESMLELEGFGKRGTEIWRYLGEIVDDISKNSVVVVDEVFISAFKKVFGDKIQVEESGGVDKSQVELLYEKIDSLNKEIENLKLNGNKNLENSGSLIPNNGTTPSEGMPTIPTPPGNDIIPPSEGTNLSEGTIPIPPPPGKKKFFSLFIFFFLNLFLGMEGDMGSPPPPPPPPGMGKILYKYCFF